MVFGWRYQHKIFNRQRSTNFGMNGKIPDGDLGHIYGYQWAKHASFVPKWPLPNRRHIVITDKNDDIFPGCEVVFSIDEAVEKVKNEPEAFIIGGGMIYRQFYPLAGKLYLTVVHQPFEADIYFPEINYSEWNEISREDFHDEKNGFNYSNINLQRSDK
nr:thymidylate synthase [uncultured bacterium]